MYIQKDEYKRRNTPIETIVMLFPSSIVIENLSIIMNFNLLQVTDKLDHMYIMLY